MGKNSVVEMLPAEIRNELNRKLHASRFLKPDLLLPWLEECGYTVSSSALYRYARSRKESIEQDGLTDSSNVPQMKLKCLELAIKFCPQGSMQELTAIADDFFNYIYD